MLPLSLVLSLLPPPFIYEDPYDYVGPNHMSRIMSPAHSELISNLNFICNLNTTSPCNLIFSHVLRLGCRHLCRPLFCLPTIVSYIILANCYCFQDPGHLSRWKFGCSQEGFLLISIPDEAWDSSVLYNRPWKKNGTIVKAPRLFLLESVSSSSKHVLCPSLGGMIMKQRAPVSSPVRYVILFANSNHSSHKSECTVGTEHLTASEVSQKLEGR